VEGRSTRPFWIVLSIAAGAPCVDVSGQQKVLEGRPYVLEEDWKVGEASVGLYRDRGNGSTGAFCCEVRNGENAQPAYAYRVDIASEGARSVRFNVLPVDVSRKQRGGQESQPPRVASRVFPSVERGRAAVRGLMEGAVKATEDWEGHKRFLADALSDDTTVAYEGWRRIAVDLERAHEKHPQHLGILRDLVVAYTQLNAFEDDSLRGSNLCALVPQRIAQYGLLAGRPTAAEQRTFRRALGRYPRPGPRTLVINNNIPLPVSSSTPECQPQEKIIPKGVKIFIDDAMLARVLNSQGADIALQEIEQLEDSLLAAGDEIDAYRKLEQYMGTKKKAFLESTCEFQEIDHVRLVSLKALIERLDAYRNRWDKRPDELRTVGGLTRIHGFLRNPANDDLLLIGQAGPSDPAIQVDNLIVGLRSVWQDGVTPTCSLDPEPDNLGGPQHVRLSGIAKDSAFAKIMLDADYAMKKILFRVEGEQLDIPGWQDLDLHIKDLAERGPSEARAWLFPVQPGPNEVHLGPCGNWALFDARVQVLTEEGVFSEEGFVGVGTTSIAREHDARLFTKHYDQIARQRPVFKELRGLFDIVLLGKIVRLLSPADHILSALLKHAHQPVEVPRSYVGVTVVHTRGKEKVIRFSGGCNIRSRFGV